MTTTTSAQQVLTAEVRELVRSRGIDPLRERREFDRLIASALGDYNERAHRGQVPALADAPACVRAITDLLAGFGPLQRYLDADDVEELWINGPTEVWVARGGRPELTTVVLAPGEVEALVERMLKVGGRRLDRSTPFVDAALPDGSRLHVAVPDVTREHWAVNIRKHVVRAASLADLVRLGTLASAPARFLDAAVKAGLNVLVAGGTQAGKTTLLGALCGSVPATARVITVEEVFELAPDVRDCVAMQCRGASLEGTGEITLRRLVKEALRMRPSRLIVGEVRQGEALDLLISLNSGVPGMCTLHANSALDALGKLCLLPLLAGENVSSAFVVPTVASAIDLVVYLRLGADGRRQVTDIVGVTGRVETDTIETSCLYRLSATGGLERGSGQPPGAARFAQAGFDLSALLQPSPEVGPTARGEVRRKAQAEARQEVAPW